MMPSDEESERLKYEQVWSFDEYRRYAPGESLVDKAIQDLGIQAGDSLLDFGCGTGRATRSFMEKGICAEGIDHASNCLDKDVNITLHRHCLWYLPPTLTADWGFCTDVMEHIPTDKVHDVLMAVRMATKNGAFFQINCLPDKMGSLIGEKLHLTVRNPDWWHDAAKWFWDDIDVEVKSLHNLVLICRSHS